MSNVDDIESIDGIRAQLKMCQRELEAEKKANKVLEEKVGYLDKLLSMLPGHLYWMDRDNVCLGCNDLQAKNLRGESRDDIIGQSLHDLFSTDQANALCALNNKVMNEEKPYIREEIATMANGTRVYLSHKVPIHSASGEVVGLLGVSFDITERKRVEQELVEAKRRLEIAERMPSPVVI